MDDGLLLRLNVLQAPRVLGVRVIAAVIAWNLTLAMWPLQVDSLREGKGGQPTLDTLVQNCIKVRPGPVSLVAQAGAASMLQHL